jgi:hypothetical protein
MITPVDTNKVKVAFETANNEWGIKMTATVKCPDCGKTYSVDVPVDPVGFFSV